MARPLASVFRPLPNWVQLSPEKCYNESEQRRGCVQESPYWNPRHETMPRDQIEALQVRKLKNLVAWTQERVPWHADRKSTRLNSSHANISYAVFCLKKKTFIASSNSK